MGKDKSGYERRWRQQSGDDVCNSGRWRRRATMAKADNNAADNDGMGDRAVDYDKEGIVRAAHHKPSYGLV
jgi:hypothetical protein